MNWTTLSPYLVPLMIAAFFLRRALRVQKAKRVRFASLWLFPVLLLLVTVSSLAHEPAVGGGTIVVFLLAGAAGGAIGWFRVHTLEFSVDSQSGRVLARANQWGAVLVVALIAIRYAADIALKKFGLFAGGGLVHATDAMLVFTTTTLVTRNAHTWIRARAALSEHQARVEVSASADREGG